MATSPRPDYSPAQRRRGRAYFIGFELVNSLSFTLLAGNLITLLLLRLGAGSTLIGVVAAFQYASFFFMPLAKGLVGRWGLVGTFGRAWTARYLAVIPLVFAPLVVLGGDTAAGIWLILGAYLVFQIMRGFGLVSISPLVNEVSAGKDRGAWLSRKSMVTTLASIAGGVAIGLLLGEQSSLVTYSLFMAVGVVLGLLGCWMIFQVPEPPNARIAAASSFRKDVALGWQDPAFRIFLLAFALLTFVVGLGRPFLIVFAKQVFHFGDDSALILTVIGSLGSVLMAWISRTVMDRVGAKPLLIVWTVAYGLALLPLLLVGPLDGWLAWGFLAVVFIGASLGGSGGENTSQAYFFGLSKPELQFNLGMLYYLVAGAAGGLGSFFGGWSLDLLAGGHTPLGQGYQTAFFWYFLLVVVLIGVSALVLGRLAPAGGRKLVDALQNIFSPRDLRIMNLLRRMDQAPGPEEEQALLRSLPASPNDIAVEEVLRRLDSPLYAVRAEALLVLEKLPLTARVQDALIRHVREHQFASAYRAARILGQQGIQRALPALRESLASQDYQLQAYTASALGNLADHKSRPALESLLLLSENPLVIVHVLEALRKLGHPDSLAPVLGLMGRSELPAFLQSEGIFTLARLLEMDNWLYAKFLVFRENPDTGLALLKDALEARSGGGREPGLAEQESKAFQPLLASFAGTADFRTAARAVLLHLEGRQCIPGVQARLFQGSLVNDNLMASPEFCYFLAAWLVWSRDS